MNVLTPGSGGTSVWDSSCTAHFHAECPTRELFDQIVDKWSVMVLAVLERGPQRFNAIRRALEGVSQKSLTQTLRRLERNGLVTRQVLATSPVAVEYALSDLGRTLLPAFFTLYHWVKASVPAVQKARDAFDRAAG
jgi:DNA-binding HxlR family transcriptional regulator